MFLPQELESFATLIQAVEHGDITIIPGTALATGERVAVVCAVNCNPDDASDDTYVPLARLVAVDEVRLHDRQPDGSFK